MKEYYDWKTFSIWIGLVALALGVFIGLLIWENTQTKEIPINKLYKYLNGEEKLKKVGIVRIIDEEFNNVIYINKKGDMFITDYKEYYFLEEKTQ